MARKREIEAEDKERGLPLSADNDSVPADVRGAEYPPPRKYTKRDPDEADPTQLFPLAGTDDVVVLFRRNEQTLEYDMVQRHPGGVTFDDVQEAHGGGKFRATLRGILRTTGRKGRLGLRDFDIEGPPKYAGKAPPSLERDGDGDDAAPNPPSGGRAAQLYDAALLQLFQQMQDNSKMTIAMVSKMVQSVSSGPSMTDIAALIAAVNGKGANSEGSPLELALRLVEVMKGDEARRAPTETKSGMAALKDMLEVQAMLRETAEAAGGDGGGGKSSWLDLARDFAPQVIQAVKGAAAADAQRRAATPAATPGAEPVDVIAQFAAGIPVLVDAASNNENPALVATNILGSAGPLIDPLTRELADPTFTDRFLTAYTQLSPWRPWVESVVAELRQRRGLGPKLVAEAKPRPTL